MEFDKELLYKNAIRSIEDGIIDIKELDRNEAGIKNLYSGLLLLYKYYICRSDEALIFKDTSLKRQHDKSYKLIINNMANTINVSGIYEAFEILGEDTYFKRRLLGKEFKVLEKIDEDIFLIIKKRIRTVLIETPKELTSLPKELQAKMKKIRELVSKKDTNKITKEQFQEKFLELISKDFIIQTILLKGILSIIDGESEDGQKIKTYLEGVNNSNSSEIKNIFEKLRNERNSIEHHYINDTEELNQMVLLNIENYKLIIWDFLEKYLNKNLESEFSTKVRGYFTENEKLILELINKRYEIIKNSILDKYNLEIEIEKEKILECPYCPGSLEINYEEEKILCDGCEEKFSYEEFISEHNKKKVLYTDLEFIDSSRFDEDVYFEEFMKCPCCDEENSLIFLKILDSIVCSKCKKDFTMEELLLSSGFNQCREDVPFGNDSTQCDKICIYEVCSEHNYEEQENERLRERINDNT